MGFRIACAAIPTADKDNVLARLGLKLTTHEDEFNETEYSGGDVDNGYFLIWKNTSDIDFSKKERVVLNSLPDCLIMAVSETVMSGIVCKVKNAAIEWQITYIGHEEEPRFETEGLVPDHITNLYKTLESKSDDEDVDETYEILSLTFKHYTGHKYDMGHDFKFLTLAAAGIKKLW